MGPTKHDKPYSDAEDKQAVEGYIHLLGSYHNALESLKIRSIHGDEQH